jgi:hypothetical protein
MYIVKDTPMYGAIIGDGYEMKLDNISHIELNIESPVDPSDLSLRYIRGLNKSFEATIESSSRLDFLEEICNPPSFPCEIEGTVKRIQKRRHKKFRINKKWAKRYGYYEVKVKGKINSDISFNWSDNEYPRVEATITDIEVYTE